MAIREVSTKEQLLTLIDDIQIATKELFERLIAPKPEKLSSTDQVQLIELIMRKNEDLKDVYQLAQEQGELEETMSELQAEVNQQDQEILTLQKNLKEAETLLSTALYQAKQKLEQMTKAQEHSVSSEELIKFAHRISSTNAVSAPLNWVPGDPRRPYPTDLEMRMGILGRLSDLPIAAQSSSLLDSIQQSNGISGGGGSTFTYQFNQNNPAGATPDHTMASGSYLHPPHFSTTVGVDPSTRNHEDVDLMSSDSSSTSSSDSQ